MKRMIALCALLALLTGCRPAEPEPVETIIPESTAPETTVPETTVPETTVPPITDPPHSELYIPGIQVEDVVSWFNEVCLDGEYVEAGDPSVVQKWMEPITYYLHGEPTEEDLSVMDDFVRWLNTVHGFPGISRTDNPEEANLHIHFTDQQGLLNIMGSEYTYLDGSVTFWYDSADVIYDAVICIRTDLPQQLRNSVILEELYNVLGPIQDTTLRPDSIIYQEYSEQQVLSEVDELILKLLYHPDVLCSMDAAECEAVICSLYS